MLGIVAAAFIPHFLIQAFGPKKILAFSLLLLGIEFVKRQRLAVSKFFILSTILFNLIVLFYMNTAEPMNSLIKNIEIYARRPCGRRLIAYDAGRLQS